MVFLTIFIFHLFLINIISKDNNINLTNIAILNFREYYPSSTNKIKNEFNSNDFKSYIFSNIYLELEINNEIDDTNQILNTIINTKTNSLDLNQLKNNNICNFNISSFNSFKKMDNNSQFCLVEEKIKIFTDINLTKYKYIPFLFDDFYCLNNSLCGKAGIDIYSQYNRKTSFITQLHNILNISEQSWVFIYSSNDKGIFIFGDMPHKYLNNTYKESNLISFYSKSTYFEIIMDSFILEYNNKSTINSWENDEYINVEISPNIEGIEIGNIYFNYIYNFFYSYINNNICKLEIIDLTITIIYCDGNKFGKKDIYKFPNIIFNKYKFNFNISFKNEELFYYKDSKYFLKIYKKFGVDKKFTLGRIFLKKYLTVFNADKKQIYFYNNNIIKKENNERENWISKNMIIIIIIFIFTIIIFLIIGIFIGKIMYKNRKKIANELVDDNYIYENNKKENNNLLFNSIENEE